MDITDIMAIEKLTLTGGGTEDPHTLPEDTIGFMLHALDGDVDMLVTAGGDVWTIPKGGKESFQSRTFSRKVLLFSGATGVTLQILTLKGLLA